jgi:hypothetical protein
MNDEPDLFAIVPLPAPGPAREALLRDAIAFGGSDELLRKFFACEAVEQSLADQQQQTATMMSRVAEIGAHLMDQVEALTVRQDKQARLDAKRKADKARRDAEAEARAEHEQILEYLETHPEPASLSDDTHHPGGELHDVDPVDQERFNPEGSEDDAGAVPLSYRNVPESYIKGEATEDLEEPGIGGASYPEPDPEDLGGPKDPKQVPQPVSASFW